MFRVEITEGQTVMNGTTQEILAGLCCYIDALKEVGIPKKLIRKSIELSFEGDSKKSKVETILDNNELKIQKIDLNNISREEAMKLLDKEILDKMFE